MKSASHEAIRKHENKLRNEFVKKTAEIIEEKFINDVAHGLD